MNSTDMRMTTYNKTLVEFQVCTPWCSDTATSFEPVIRHACRAHVSNTTTSCGGAHTASLTNELYITLISSQPCETCTSTAAPDGRVEGNHPRAAI